MYEIIVRKGIIALGKATRFLGILLALAILAGALAVPGYAASDCCEHELCDDEWCEYFCDGECDEYCIGCEEDGEDEDKDEGEDEGGYEYKENVSPKSFLQRVWDFIQFFLDGLSFSYEVNRKMDWEFLDVFSAWFDNSRGFEFSGSGLIDFLLRFRALFG